MNSSGNTELAAVINPQLYRKMKNHTKAYIAYLFICIVWGTTYLGIRVAVLHYPPFLMAGVRQFVSGIILITVALAISRKADWRRKNLLLQAFIGFLLITVGNGLVTWAEQYVSSGVAALICSTMPITGVLINVAMGKERLNIWIILGMLLGFGGVAVIFQDNLQSSQNNLFVVGIIALVVATLGWALGSILNKTKTPAVNSLLNSGLQVICGGGLMLLISPFADNYDHLVLWNKEGFMALCYLIVFGSVLAYAAYMYALKELPVGFVMSYAYVNPLVAVILGYFFMSEPLNSKTIIAFILIISGIVIVRRGYQKQQRAPEPMEE